MRKIVLTILFAIVCADKPSNQLIDEIQSIPTSYQFSYSTGNEGPAQSFREEQRSHDGSVIGKYGYVDPNGKLRVVQYRAGANGYSASGDVGPDPEVQKEAQLLQQADPSVQIQQEIWNKVRSGNWRGWGANSWIAPKTSWNSGVPNWNAAPPTPLPTPQPQPPQPSPPTVESERQWDDRSQNQWQNANSNAWKSNLNSKSDWNTWNSEQQNWNKPNAGTSWTSNIQHQWQKAQTGRFSNNNYQSPQVNLPPVQYPSAPQSDPNPAQWTVPYRGAAKWTSPKTETAVDDWADTPTVPQSQPWSPPTIPSPPSAQWQNSYESSSKWSPPRADLLAAGWPQPPGPNENPLSRGAFTHFSIEHSGPNIQPSKYQYSY